MFELNDKLSRLFQVPDDDKDNKLFSVKYNCYRNIGLIYEEREELRQALRYLVQASELDDTDVYTQCKIGRLSLKLNNLMLAKIAFERCLERNSNHCGAKDGLLETLCLMEDVTQAYGFALQCFEQDRQYGRAIRVLKEIRARFLGSLDYYDG
jgi:tetratricopeptide (TPR) repeat protein